MLTTIARFVTHVFIAIGATVLTLMMFLTAADVGMRYLVNRPIPGAFELVEYMMAVVIPFSIVYCAHERGHVAVELILARFSPRVQKTVDAMTTFVAMVFAGIISWQSFLYIGEVRGTGLTSSVLLIPTYPFVIPVALGIGAFALILLVHFLEFFSKVKKV